MTRSRDRFSRAIDAAILCALKLAIGVWVLRLGFSHVSDDDFARTVISEQFAYAPKIDPSGTSWLPLPFWLDGVAMSVGGRSLGVARGMAMALSAAAVAAPYFAMRTVGMKRAPAFMATAAAMALPWNAWLGVATVPEGWTGAIVGASAISMASERARPWAAAGLLTASLSRYEAWPASATLIALSVTRVAEGENPRRELAIAVVAAFGPLAWMAWNLHAHGTPFHFLSRVASYRHAIGAADMPLRDKVFGYPRVLVMDTPEVAVLGGLGLLGIATSPRLRSRWRWAIAASIAILVFLIVGDVRDGAPTHHAARALSPLWWIFSGMGIDAVSAAILNREWAHNVRVAAGCAAFLAGASWCASMPGRWGSYPGRSASERRDVQVARGLDLRDRGVLGADVTPCEYEHFALIAAWGEPERVHVEQRSGEAIHDGCPRVAER